jgi:hypothetical protein
LPPTLASRRPAPCSGCARRRGFENTARRLLSVRCCDDVPWGMVTRYGAGTVAQFGPFERRREDVL